MFGLRCFAVLLLFTCLLALTRALGKFEQEVLDEHNKYRSMHQVPPLKYSKKLAKSALAWAKKIAVAGKLTRSKTKYGESTYEIEETNISGAKPVDSWYEGSKSYDFNNPKSSVETGRFSQIVWKNTKQLGAGIVVMNGKTYVVVHYHPIGNVPMRFKENVLEAKT